MDDLAGSRMRAVGTIYIVDDDAAVGDSMCVLLAAYGIKAKHFFSAEAFLREVRSFDDACLVVDVHMREMGGLDLLQRLRDDGVSAPVIIPSGRVDPSLTRRAEKLGVIGVLSKPVDSAGFLDLIDRAQSRLGDNP